MTEVSIENVRKNITIRRGLVLSGGGAKGAYAFGCMVALKRLGYNFEVVAGTSAGALNAALWGTSSLRLGFKIWRGLCFEQMLPSTLARRGAPKWIVWFAASLHVVAALVTAVLRRQRHVATKSIALILSVLHATGVSGLYIFLCWALPANDSTGWFLALCFVAGNSACLYRGLIRQEEEAQYQFFIGYFFALCIPIFRGIALPIGIDLGKGPVGMTAGVLAAVLLLLLLFLLGSAVFLALRWTFSPIRRHTVFSLDRIEYYLNLVTSKKWQCTCLVTTAESIDIFDPTEGVQWVQAANDADHEYSPRSVLDPIFRKRAVRPMTKRVWYPNYVEVSSPEIKDAAAHVLASAALPFGLTAPVQIGESQYVDGGVVDNTPWFPMIDYELDEIIIVALEPYGSEQDAIEKLKISVTTWKENRFFVENAKMFFPMDPVLPEETAESLDQFLHTYAHFQRVNEKIVSMTTLPRIRVLYPESAIGGFIDGTLRFDPSFAKRLIRLGATDTYARLASISTQ